MSLLFLPIEFPNKKKGTRKWWHLISFQGGTRTRNPGQYGIKWKNHLNCCSSHWITDWFRRSFRKWQSRMLPSAIFFWSCFFKAIASIPDCCFLRDDHSNNVSWLRSQCKRVHKVQNAPGSWGATGKELSLGPSMTFFAILPKVWTSILPSHGRSLFQRCPPPPLDGAPFVKCFFWPLEPGITILPSGVVFLSETHLCIWGFKGHVPKQPRYCTRWGNLKS